MQRFRTTALILVLSGAAGLQSCANTTASSSPTAIDPVPEGVPAFRVTAPNGATSILIGSLHIPADGLRQPAASVMDGAKRYVVEGIDEGKPSPMLAFHPEVLAGRSLRAPWAERLTDEQVETLITHAQCNGAAATQAKQTVELLLAMRSPAPAADVAIRRCASPGLKSRDALLEAAARQRGLAPLPLESQDFANKQRMTVPDRISEATLYRSFTAGSVEGLRRTVRALNHGEFDEVTQALRDLSTSPMDAETTHRLMVGERNAAWMPVLTGFLDDGGAVVNVGAAHLPGADGLVMLLRSRGYAVQPIVLPAEGSN